MACFLAPVAEAIVVTIVKKSVEKKESAEAVKNADTATLALKKGTHIPFSKKLGWLTKLLWGGAYLLALEHIWHGEVVPWPPFLTAMNNPADIQPMLMEIATVGSTMAILITAVWCGMLLVARYLENRETKTRFNVKVTEG